MDKYLIFYESSFYHTFCAYKVETDTMKKAINEFRKDEPFSDILAISKLDNDVEWEDIEVD